MAWGKPIVLRKINEREIVCEGGPVEMGISGTAPSGGDIVEATIEGSAPGDSSIALS